MRRAAWILAGLVAGCASGEATGGSYGLAPGVANYDTLKAATDKCHTDGGELKLKGGYEPQELSSYECKIGAK